MRTLLSPQALTEGELTLDPGESHHARSVLRLRPGDHCRICDGQGRSALGIIERLERHAVQVRVCRPIEEHPLPPGQQLCVALAAPKGGRFEYALCSLVELGVGSIVIFRCQRSARLPKLDRLQRCASEALKQCQRPWMPDIHLVESLESWQPRGQVLLCSPQGRSMRPSAATATTLIIGPEGGLTQDEEERLLKAGAEPLCLAPFILRIETAACAAAAVWTQAWESSYV